MVAEKFLPESPTTRFEIKSCRALTKQQNPPVTDLFSTLTVVAAVAGAIGMAGSAVLAAIKLAVFLYKHILYTETTRTNACFVIFY